jgi:hypothetical protein
MIALGKKLGIIAIAQIKDIMKGLNGYFYNGGMDNSQWQQFNATGEARAFRLASSF